MPDYSKSKIYTIRYKNDTSLIYVGSTTQQLCKRWREHKCYYNCGDERSLLYNKMRETNDFDNWYIELYEECPCENKEQLLKKEGEIIRLIGTLNKIVSGRTRKERYNDTKLHHYEKVKEWKMNNVEKVKEIQKKYRETHKDERKQIVKCECGCDIAKYNIARHLRTSKHQESLDNAVSQYT